jgi:signal transduction histidine kinase
MRRWPWRRARPTFRLRLTGLFLILFVAVGAVLLALTYLLVQHALSGVAVSATLRGPSLPGTPAPPRGPTTVAELRDFLTRYRRALHDETLRELLVQSSIALGVTTAVGALGAWLVAGRILRPLRHVTDTARRLSQETLDQRIALRGPNDELRQLADTFDGMLARLQEAFDSQRRFMANVSHELRSPLATQRTLIEVALASPNRSPERFTRTLSALLGAVDEQQRLVEGLLVLAASERGIDHREPVDLRSLVAEAVDAGRARAATHVVTIEADLSAAAVAGHRPLLRRMVENLVENGIQYNRAGGWVRLRLATSTCGATLVVANSGPVVPRERIDSLFEPFRRLDGDRMASSGLGLGLSIVRAVVLTHGGSIRAEPGGGGGLEVTVALPGLA